MSKLEKHILQICLFNPSTVDTQILFEGLKGYPVLYVACTGLSEHLKFVPTNIQVHKKEQL